MTAVQSKLGPTLGAWQVSYICDGEPAAGREASWYRLHNCPTTGLTYFRWGLKMSMVVVGVLSDGS